MPFFAKLHSLSFGLLVLLATSGPFLYAGPGGADFDCSRQLARADMAELTDGPLAPPFLATPELFFTDGGYHAESLAFMASNEFDWFNTPWDDSPTDVLVGFGTNSAWDLAVRQNPQLLITGDWTLAPLVSARFIIRPLLKLARTPIEFMLLLRGLETPPHMVNKSMADFDKLMTQQPRFSDREMRVSFMRIRSRLIADGATSEELAATMAYYESLLVSPPRDSFGMIYAERAQVTGHLQTFFDLRYRHAQNRARGAPPETFQRPNFSFVSSQSAFDQLKRIYAASLYAHTDFMSEAFYLKLKALGDARGYKTYTFSITNILDAKNSESNVAQSLKELAAFRTKIYRIFPAPQYKVVLFFTTGTGELHNFHRLERNSVVNEADWLPKPR